MLRQKKTFKEGIYGKGLGLLAELLLMSIMLLETESEQDTLNLCEGITKYGKSFSNEVKRLRWHEF